MSFRQNFPLKQTKRKNPTNQIRFYKTELELNQIECKTEPT